MRRLSKAFLLLIFAGLSYGLYRLARGGDTVAVLYATLIINGRRTFSQVPTLLQPEVKQILIDADLGYLAEESAAQ
jgi:hypothetical protein